MKGLKSMILLKIRVAAPIAILALLAGCVTAPPPQVYRVAAPAPPPQRVFVYPASGQTPEQTERDRYDCHVWAVQQTGVDPSRPESNTYQRVVVQSPAVAPGSGVVGGAVAGTIIGAIIGGPWNAGAALLGGATGALIGGAAESSANANAHAQAQQVQQQVGQSNAQVRAGSDSYRRAFGACLVGRGYTVS
jgi:hypothetical protein